MMLSSHRRTGIFFCWGALPLLCSMAPTGIAQSHGGRGAPQLHGEKFHITVAQESGFVNIDKAPDGSLSFSGYCIDMIESISRPERANFTYELRPPSGFGSLCGPKLDMEDPESVPYLPQYYSQYKCGQSDVNDIPQTEFLTDMYLSLYYVTPERQRENHFTLPYHPPSTGTLTMFGTATRINNFQELAEKQKTGSVGPACAAENAAYIDFLKDAFPEMKFVEVPNSQESFYNALQQGTCSVIISDYPVATHFTLQQFQKDRCKVGGKPIGVIGQPLGYGLNQYAIGIRRDIPIEVVDTLSYWLNILMTCSPGDPDGDCPSSEGGNFYDHYDETGGTGEECGYVLNPTEVSKAAIAGIVVGSVTGALILYALWCMRRIKASEQRRVKKLKEAAEAEKAAIIVENATKAAKSERELNDYIAHEVRNPLAAALSACSFVLSAVGDETIPLTTDEARRVVTEDALIINSSLHFINDLLRNMLDMQRAASNQLKLEPTPTDLLKDVLQPVDTMLYRREKSFEVIVECPKDLHIMSDRLRLKQIILNLGRNAAKFVDHGFIRLRAAVVNNCVHLYVEDSGPGIPIEKRKILFAKFQDSLDSLNQGTGIGLCLCKNLAQLMNGDIWLDESYHSGVEGCPGTRFIINLNTPPMTINDDLLDSSIRENYDSHRSFRIPMTNHSTSDEDETHSGSTSSGEIHENLPEEMCILFVDDDAVLRKLFARSIKKIRPAWIVKEASNGETALRIVDEEDFGIIFVDQYMASVERQLLGTETVRALRSKGVRSPICGLSANDVEQSFREAGANYFMFKPFPCKPAALKREISSILCGKQNGDDLV
mmetsp:Transcript_5711/g.8801  ORF Transcript_5711/g.8801 Transcript_5711/m.8801 type:complete len:830 (-) Transcript_5711:2106-4595(-)